MKTLTIKTAQNIPIHSSYIIEVDGKKIGLVKPGETGYFDIEEDAKSIVAKMQGAKSDLVDISENQHHALMIDSKKQILSNLIFTMGFLGLSLMIHFYLKLKLEYLMMIQISLGFLMYILYKKSKFNTLRLSLMKNI